MINYPQLLTDSAIYIAIATISLLGLVFYGPRLMLQDYPPAIKAIVPPKTDVEKRQSILFGMPFLMVLLILPFVFVLRLDETSFLGLFLHAFGVVWAFNLWDWLVLDWLIFCTITPKAFVIPGSEGHPAYKDYAFHFRGFLIGTVFSLVIGVIVATVAYFI
ncbi:MAG: nitroreductase [Chloroflexi bacterium HGW-Chloroflexi-6]|nr:MAG: nitroreductase [Chloroflexi bacterium HGW-Chloroflexi-6]